MKERFYSLDVFRGATVCLMIMVNNPGTWDHIYAPLDHSPWNGVTPTDIVFPFFLFVVGNALAFVIPRLEAGGSAFFWRKVLTRTLVIFGIGLLLNWTPFLRWEDHHIVFKSWTYADTDGQVVGVRIMGVLQRIALAYFFASVIIYFLKIRGAFYTACLLLLGYWFLCVAAHPSDPFSRSGWFGTRVDMAILGEPHMYHGELLDGHPIAFDPEGFMSLFGAIVQVIFGYLVGDYIRKKGKSAEMLNGLFVMGLVLMFAGYLWNMVFPINKKIWTSSYVVYTTGLATVILGIITYVVEIKQRKGWITRFFDVFGKNPLFIFVLSGFLPRLFTLIRIPDGMNAQGTPDYVTPFGWFYEHLCQPLFSDLRAGSLFYALCLITFYWLIVYWMDRKKIYIKV
ncbi:MAG: DUF1624 domain-containing protein [Bacteroidota bacterium]|nr:DUF1624 domain-containing protein [Bacteroidota bacterium]